MEKFFNVLKKMQFNLAKKFLRNINLLKKKQYLILTLKSIVLNNRIDYHIRVYYYFKFLKLLKYTKMCKLKTRCILSNNSRFLIRIFGLNRIKLKKFFNLGYINGYSKSSW